MKPYKTFVTFVGLYPKVTLIQLFGILKAELQGENDISSISLITMLTVTFLKSKYIIREEIYNDEATNFKN